MASDNAGTAGTAREQSDRILISKINKDMMRVEQAFSAAIEMIGTSADLAVENPQLGYNPVEGYKTVLHLIDAKRTLIKMLPEDDTDMEFSDNIPDSLVKMFFEKLEEMRVEAYEAMDNLERTVREKIAAATQAEDERELRRQTEGTPVQ